jgi:hypothetical protein
VPRVATRRAAVVARSAPNLATDVVKRAALFNTRFAATLIAPLRRRRAPALRAPVGGRDRLALVRRAAVRPVRRLPPVVLRVERRFLTAMGVSPAVKFTAAKLSLR